MSPLSPLTERITHLHGSVRAPSNPFITTHALSLSDAGRRTVISLHSVRRCVVRMSSDTDDGVVANTSRIDFSEKYRP